MANSNYLKVSVSFNGTGAGYPAPHDIHITPASIVAFRPDKGNFKIYLNDNAIKGLGEDYKDANFSIKKSDAQFLEG